MTGPGRVWIQTLPFSRLADRVLAGVKGDREEVKRDFGGAIGALYPFPLLIDARKS